MSFGGFSCACGLYVIVLFVEWLLLWLYDIGVFCGVFLVFLLLGVVFLRSVCVYIMFIGCFVGFVSYYVFGLIIIFYL